MSGDTVIKSFGTFLTNIPEVAEQSKKFIVGAAPAHQIETIVLPKNFDGRQVWKRYLSDIKNQGHCGMCYSCASVGSMADRYNILSLGSVHLNLSASDMVMCMTTDPKFTAEYMQWNKRAERDYHAAELETRKKFACNGNTLYNAAKYLYIVGAPEESCIPDSLVRGITDNKNVPFCEDVEGMMFDHCVDKVSAQRYFRAGTIYQLPYDSEDLEKTEKQIMYDIYKWGPIAGGFLMYDDFLNNYDGTTIYRTKGAGEAKMGHAIRIVGWGEENEGDRVVKYWICANSWSTDWGDGGYFKIEKFLPGLDLEKNIVSLIPDLPGIVKWRKYNVDSLISEADEAARQELGVDSFANYPSSAVEKIKDGVLKGDLLDILIDPQNLPASYANFIAGRINTYDLESIRNRPPRHRSSKLWLLILSCLLAFLLGIGATILFYRRDPRRFAPIS